MSPSAHENKEANDDRRVLVLGTRTEQRGWSSRCENGRNSPWSNLCAVMGIAEWFMPVAWGGLFVRSWYTSNNHALYARSN